MATVTLGYALSSEEHTPNDLVRHARLAEKAGFSFALISDHSIPGSMHRDRAYSYGASSARSPTPPSGLSLHGRHVISAES